MAQGNQFLRLRTFEEELAERAELSGFTSAICYLFLSILGGICIMNLINTMTNSVYVRRRELGMMQALGMSEKAAVTAVPVGGTVLYAWLPRFFHSLWEPVWLCVLR